MAKRKEQKSSENKSRQEIEAQKRLDAERNRSLNALRGGQKGPTVQPLTPGHRKVSLKSQAQSTPPGFQAGQFKPVPDNRPFEQPVSRQVNNDLDPRRRRASSSTNPASSTPTAPVRLPINPDLLPKTNPNLEPQRKGPLLEFDRTQSDLDSDDMDINADDDDPFQILDEKSFV